MVNNLIEIVNLPDDLERKVIRFAFLEIHKDFEYLTIAKNGIPNLNELRNYRGFAVRPIEGDTSIDFNNKTTTAGTYIDHSFSFTIEKQEDTDVIAVEKYKIKKGVLIIETSTYNYMVGSYEEPLRYTYKEDNKIIKVSCSGSQRRKPLRKKISPF